LQYFDRANKNSTFRTPQANVPATKANKTAENPMKALRKRLSEAGVKRKFLDEAVLPSWWDESHALEPGGFREAAAYIAAHLGYSLKSLTDPDAELSFSHVGNVKFKKAKDKSPDDVCLATQVALGLARSVAKACAEQPAFTEIPPAQEWRDKLLQKSDKPWVCLRHILQFAWVAGVPVVRLTNLPAGAKKPDALTTMVGGRPVIVILSGWKSPSWIAFIVAHELGHIHHGHLKPGQTLVDGKIDSRSDEKDEIEANNFAGVLLTGHPDLGLHSSSKLGPPQLARQAKEFGKKYRVAPGVAALNYGFNTGAWPVAIGALTILEKADDAGEDLNKAMLAHLNEEETSEESWEWISRTTATKA
jgi:Zn-dependent peptidase ImmA (M78 family)